MEACTFMLEIKLWAGCAAYRMPAHLIFAPIEEGSWGLDFPCRNGPCSCSRAQQGPSFAKQILVLQIEDQKLDEELGPLIPYHWQAH